MIIAMKSKTSKKTKEPTLDLHGYKTSDVPAAVDAFLVKHQSAAKIRIMTGKGTGQVRKVAQDYLRLGGYHYYYETLDNGNKNDGVLVVPLDDE